MIVCENVSKNPNYCSVDGVLYNKDTTTLVRCPGGKTKITFPDSVTTIGDYAFIYCDSFETINYTGTEEQWTVLLANSGTNNTELTNATINCNYTGE